MTLSIRHQDGAGEDALEAYILRDPASLVYSSPSFMRLVADHIGSRPGWFIAERDGAVAGVLPYQRRDGWLGPVFNSLAYYGSNGGVLQDHRDAEAYSALVSAFYSAAEAAGAVAATIVTNPLDRDAGICEAVSGFDCRDERIGQITHLPADADELLARFDDPRPRNIRRALRVGVAVERTQGDEALRFLWETHTANMQAIGGRAKRSAFFEAVPRVMREADWSVYLARQTGTPVAALLVFRFNRTVEYFTPVIVEEFRSTQALSLTIYAAMQDAVRDGYANWNWGGTWLAQDGVYDFKRRWATTDYRYHYYTRIFNAAVRREPAARLLEEYEGMYVLPFGQLEEVSK